MNILDFMNLHPVLTGWLSFAILIFIQMFYSQIEKYFKPKYNYDIWAKELKESFDTYAKCIKFIEECEKLHEIKTPSTDIRIN